MPKKTIEEFKEVFGPIQKPKLPRNVTAKEKDTLEKEVRNDELAKFFKDSAELYKKDPGYFVDLVAYKLKKHFDNDEKRPAWLEKIPPEARKAAIAKIVPGDINDPVTKRAYEKAVSSGNSKMISLIKERDHDGVDAIEKKKASEDTKKFLNGLLNGKDDEEAIREGDLKMAWMTQDDIVDLASSNPKRFFATMLTGFKNNAKFVEFLKDRDLCNRLKKLNPTEWKKFEDGTPMLATLSKVEGEVVRKKLTRSADIMEEVFAGVLDDKVMPLGYAATPLDPNNTILSGPTKKSDDFRKLQKEKKDKQGDVMPDVPSTDCHHLLYITQSMMEMYPGQKPKITNRSCPNMLMTKPLSTIPGRGLLDRKFAGNVFDETGKPTGMVLFSGDNGINSHTWLMVDGVPFDPVLGTKGDDVAGAVQETFDWVIPQRLAKGAKGSYVVQDPELEPATNAMGFSTGYYVAKDPRQFLNSSELEQAKLK